MAAGQRPAGRAKAGCLPRCLRRAPCRRRHSPLVWGQRTWCYRRVNHLCEVTACHLPGGEPGSSRRHARHRRRGQHRQV